MKKTEPEVAIRVGANNVIDRGVTLYPETAPIVSVLSVAPCANSPDTAVGQGIDDLTGAYSIDEFCAAHGGITRQHFHSLMKRGLGPRTFKVGRRTLISRRAAAEWVIWMESVTETHQKKAA